MNASSINVLLLEDNPADARLFREHLQSTTTTSFVVSHVDRVAQAVTALEDERFDVVVVDLSVPDAHGLETFHAVRDVSPDMPIVVMTGSSDDEEAMKAVRGGAQDYITKGSVDGPVLARAIRHAIERRNLERERDQLIVQLRTALDEVKRLSGLLPICASCKKIRDDSGYWNEVEHFIQARTEADFTHGICPACSKRLYGDLLDDD